MSPDYACLPRERLDEFAELMRRTVIGFYGEDPARSPDYARIIDERHFDRLQAMATGDLIQLGKPARERRFFPPTLIRGAGWDHPALRDEIFGPMLPLVPYDDVAEPFEEIRRRPRPLALYLFSRNRAVEDRFLRGTSSGGVCINDTVRQITPLGLPFGGVGKSGFGLYRGRFGFETFSHSKSVMRRFRWGGFPFISPPYGTAWRRIERWIGGTRPPRPFGAAGNREAAADR
jgi:aldehyde dehydrogenase (NAD+)